MINELGIEQPMEAVFERYLDRLGLTTDDIRGKTILDVGAGSGAFAAMADQFGAQVVSVDLHIGGPARDDVLTSRYVQANIEALPFADDTFDMCLSVAVLNKTTTRALETALKEAKRILKPSGEFKMNGVPSILLSKQELELLRILSNQAATLSEPDRSLLMRLRHKFACQSLGDLVVAIESSLRVRQPLPADKKIPSRLEDFPPLKDGLPDNVLRDHDETIQLLEQYGDLDFSVVPSMYLREVLRLLRSIEPSFEFHHIREEPTNFNDTGYFYFTK